MPSTEPVASLRNIPSGAPPRNVEPFAAPASSDAHVAIIIIAGIVVMFIVGVLLLVFAMASDRAA